MEMHAIGVGESPSLLQLIPFLWMCFTLTEESGCLEMQPKDGGRSPQRLNIGEKTDSIKVQ